MDDLIAEGQAPAAPVPDPAAAEPETAAWPVDADAPVPAAEEPWPVDPDEPAPAAPEPWPADPDSEPSAAAAAEEPWPVDPDEPAPPADADPPPPAPAPPEPDEAFAWSEPGDRDPAPAASDPDPAPEPPAAADPADAADPPTRAHDALPPKDLDPPPLPARASARPLPQAPRRRYAQADARRSPAQGPVRKRRSWAARIAAVVFLVGVIFAIWFLFSLFQPGKGSGHDRVAVTIPAGSNAKEIGTILADQGVVSSGFFFNLRATISGKRGDFKAGRYTLAQDMSYSSAMDALSQTPVAAPTISITLPEGLSRREMAPRVKKAGISGSYLAASDAHKGFSTRRYGAPRDTKTLEGFLFPATYELKKSGATSTQLVGQQLDAFKANIAKVSMTKAKRKNLSTYDVLIIASMIEREAQVAKDRRLIAAVIYNRLKAKMPLGIDATTRYELNEWSQPLKVSQLEKDTPFNTRTRRGLPPTPIGNPGLASMKAAADPASVDYLYYVVKPNTCGEHNFSSSNEEFQADVAAYEAARAKNGGKSPTTC